MKEIIKALTSRKFIIAIASFATFAAMGETGAAVGVVLAYFGINVADVKVSK